MAQSSDYGLGPFDYPRGWFMIGESATLGAAPVTLHYFGKDMVFYRGESGAPHLVHAFCPHMGAHLGKNSTSYIVMDGEQVQGESIRCPFHGWRFAPDGRCDHVPYAPEGFVPPQARLKTYQVVERAGIVWMWHDPEDGPPDYDLPAFEPWDQEDSGWVRWVVDDLGVLPVHAIEIVDNMADFGHMSPIHGSRSLRYFDNSFEGHRLIQRFDCASRGFADGAFGGDGGDNRLSLDTWYEGPGILQSRMRGQFLTHMLLANTPVDPGVTRVWHALMVKGEDRADAQARMAAIRAYQRHSAGGLMQDVEIWTHKEPCLDPMQIRFDGPYRRVRAWYGQFYAPRSQAPAIHQKLNGTVVTFGDSRHDLELELA
jgi:3-ketosteroid 9alpha-monooxygenase subunit A